MAGLELALQVVYSKGPQLFAHEKMYLFDPLVSKCVNVPPTRQTNNLCYLGICDVCLLVLKLLRWDCWILNHVFCFEFLPKKQIVTCSDEAPNKPGSLFAKLAHLARSR